MAKLRKYTLSHDKKKEDWKLTEDKTDRVVKRFDTKEEATAGGVLRNAIGEGSVKIKKTSGVIQEERTFPKSKDPKESIG